MKGSNEESPTKDREPAVNGRIAMKSMSGLRSNPKGNAVLVMSFERMLFITSTVLGWRVFLYCNTVVNTALPVLGQLR